jgi:Flp pilus assembly pilin Flp
MPNNRRGSSHTEYVLIAALVSIAILSGASGIGASLTDTFMGIGDILAAF